ncbi:MAG: hypothetical protein QMD09_06620 [Desulfatibacillaceae bacterium]|nr:hypothetical protein [Desulfatibacillaceae bacterium]
MAAGLFWGGAFSALYQGSPKACGFPKKPELGLFNEHSALPEAFLQGRALNIASKEKHFQQTGSRTI